MPDDPSEIPAEPASADAPVQPSADVPAGPVRNARRPRPAPAAKPIARPLPSAAVSESIADKLSELEARLLAERPPSTVILPELPVAEIPPPAKAPRKRAKKIVPSPLPELLPEPTIDIPAPNVRASAEVREWTAPSGPSLQLTAEPTAEPTDVPAETVAFAEVDLTSLAPAGEAPVPTPAPSKAGQEGAHVLADEPGESDAAPVLSEPAVEDSAPLESPAIKKRAPRARKSIARATATETAAAVPVELMTAVPETTTPALHEVGAVDFAPLPSSAEPAPSVDDEPVATTAPVKQSRAKKAAVTTTPPTEAVGSLQASEAMQVDADEAISAETGPGKKTKVAVAPADLADTRPRRPRSRRSSEPVPVSEVPDAPTVVAEEQPQAEEATPVPAERQPFGAGLRNAVIATVLLLAAAAGMGASALVEMGDSTWEASSVVQILPGADPSVNEQDALTAGLQTYEARTGSADFDKLAAFSAGLPESPLRHSITGSAAGFGLLRLTVAASTADGANSFADAAATSMVQTITSNELSTSTAGDRLSGRVIGRAANATQVEPKTSHAVIAGVLAAVLVLVLALLALLATRRKKDSVT